MECAGEVTRVKAKVKCLVEVKILLVWPEVKTAGPVLTATSSSTLAVLETYW